LTTAPYGERGPEHAAQIRDRATTARGGDPGGTLLLVPTSHPRVQLTLDPELARAVDRAGALLDSPRGRAGLIRTLALRGAEEISYQAESESRVRAQAIEELLAHDFSQLSDIVTTRESDLADKLPLPSQPHRN
jgi:hypothetical protein